MALPTYSSRDVTINWAGYSFQDLAPDSFVTFSLNSDLTEEEVGADGNISISYSPDETGTCTISFQQGGKGDKVLSGVLALQRQNRELAKGTIVIKDPSGSVLATLSNAHVKTAPEIDLGSSASGKTRSYTFFVEKLHFIAPVEGDSDDLLEVAGSVAAIGALTGVL